MVEKSLSRFLLERAIQGFLLIIGVIVINFVIIHVAPGDPALLLAGENASKDYVEMIRTRYGLDKPVSEQLLIYLSAVLRGDFGYSFFYAQPVLSIIGERIFATLLLQIFALSIAISLGILLGVIASMKPHSITDNAITVGSVIGYSLPTFWLGIMSIILFSVTLGLFPTQGMSSVRMELTGINRALDILHHLILPGMTYSTWFLAIYARLTRANMLETLKEDYIVFARAKGLSERTVFFRHALQNAILPVVTVIGMKAGYLFTGAVLTETVFGWPGIGRLLYDSLFTRDYPVIMGIFFIVSVCVVIANFVTDIAYTFIDPRIRIT